VVQHEAAPGNCQNRYFDRISESEAGRPNSKKKGISFIYPELRIYFGQFRPEIGIALCPRKKIGTLGFATQNDSAKSYNVYGISPTKFYG
jgi:hypothetical protein